MVQHKCEVPGCVEFHKRASADEAVKCWKKLYESRPPVPSLFGEFGEFSLVAFASTKREGERE